MKRLRPSHELVFHHALLLVGLQFAVLYRKLFADFFKPLLHRVGVRRRIGVVHGHFEKPAVEEFSLHRRGSGIRQFSFAGLNFHHSQCWLISWNKYIKIQRMFGRPRDQFFWRITPAQAEGRLDDGLGMERHRKPPTERQNQEGGDNLWPFARKKSHARSIAQRLDFRKSRSGRGGFALVEATMALSLLSVAGLLLLKLSLNVTAPRQYALQQVLSSSYLTFERARAERIPFESLLGADSPWPAYPEVATETVEIGKLPGGKVVNGEVTRTRMPDANNPVMGSASNEAINPTAMEIWRVQSILRYKISDRTYVKSRTLVRSQ